MAIASVESSKSKKPAKVLSHLEIHPRMGGGHIVKHVYSSYEHPSKEVHFNEDGKAKGGEHISSHLAKHAGLPGNSGADENDEEAGDGTSEE
jgi:hypothetical protein